MDAKQTDFDAKSYGLLSHYGEEVCFEIRRRILEDQHRFNLKLPTYVDGIARAIQGTNIPRAWLERLIPQTIRKLLKAEGMQHYQVWACLHLYLIRDHGPFAIEPSVTDADILGQSLRRFAQLGDMNQFIGEHVLSTDEHLGLEISDTGGYSYATLVETLRGNDKSDVAMTKRFEGIGFLETANTTAGLSMILRDAQSKASCIKHIERSRLSADERPNGPD